MVPPIGVVSLSLRAGDVPSSRRPGVDNSGQCHDTHNSDTLRMPILPSSCGDRMSSAYFRALCNYFMHYAFLISRSVRKRLFQPVAVRTARTDRCDNTFLRNLPGQSSVLCVGCLT